jgi:hypothetical protein
LRTCNKSQKTSMLFAGSRSVTSKFRVINPKSSYMLRNAVETVLLGERTAFSYFCTGCPRQVRSTRLPARLVSGHRPCIIVFITQGRRFTECVSTNTLNHNGNHHCAHPSNIQSVGLLLMQRCRSEEDQLVLLKKQKGFSPRSGGSIVSNFKW